MYDDIELPSREQDSSTGNWRPLPRKPSKDDGNSDKYEDFNEQDDYGSISLSYALEELKAEAQPPDPDIKAGAAQSTFIPVQWKDCSGNSCTVLLLALAGGCLLLDIVLLSQYAALSSELRKRNVSSAQESFDPSTVSQMIHELKSTLITELQILENHIHKIREATNKNVKQVFRLEEKMNSSLQDLKDASNRCAFLPCKEFQGHYYYFSEMAQPWGHAKEFCAAADAHLLIINSQKEQEFVVSQMSSAVWLGLSDIATEGTWLWVDGSPVGETFWRFGEPNNVGNEEDCVILYKEKKWNDNPCNKNVRFVCEKKIDGCGALS